jgi:hypothetical protein
LPGDEASGDAVQPRRRVWTAGVIGLTPFERDTEHLAEQVVGLWADTSDEVAKDHAGVTVEELGEARGIVE